MGLLSEEDSGKKDGSGREQVEGLDMSDGSAEIERTQVKEKVMISDECSVRPQLAKPDKDVAQRESEALLGAMNLEMLFENYLNEVEWIRAEIEREIDEITNTEENVVLQLDIIRNRVLRFELLLYVPLL